MSDVHLLERAADCYRQLGMTDAAARCYRDAGIHRLAGDLFVEMGRFAEAAAEFAHREPDRAAWLLAHHADDAAGARAMLPEPSPSDESQQLRARLVRARCAIAEGAPDTAVLPDLEAARAALARPAFRDPFLEPWAVGLAEAAGREDQVALVYAAAVRGNRYGAAQRWADWMRATLGAELPPIEPPPAVS